MNDVVAMNVRAARRSMGWTQAELAEQMRAAGTPWTRAIAGYAENASRNVTIDELAALTVVFKTTPAYWLAPPADLFDKGSPVVEVGDTQLSAAWLVATAAAGDAVPSPFEGQELSPWARFFQVLGRIITREGVSSKDARLLHQALARLRGVSAQDD